MAEATLTPSVKRVAPRLNQSSPSLLLGVVISSCFDRAGKAFFHTDKQTLKPQEATAAGAKLLGFPAPRTAGRASAATTVAPGDNLLLQL